MPQFSANLDFMFQELAFEARFAAAREAGFTHVEIGFQLYEHPAETVKALLQKTALRCVLINTPKGKAASYCVSLCSSQACLPRLSLFRS